MVASSADPGRATDGSGVVSETPCGPAERPPETVPTVVLRLFAAARLAAGTASDRMAAGTVAGVIEEARARYGPELAAVIDGSRIWVNGVPAGPEQVLAEGDEVAVLPPVSGG